MTLIIRLFISALLVSGGSSYAASPFDGNWKGQGEPNASCPDKADLGFTIKDGEFVGFALVGPRGQTRNVKGVVSDNGSATLEFGTPRTLKGKIIFLGEKFEGTLDTLCGQRDFSGSRQ